MTKDDVCPACQASLAGCNRSGCDGRERAGWRGPTHPGLTAPDAATVAAMADDELHERAARYMEGEG